MCRTPGCDNEVQCPSFGLCRNCYSAMLRWLKRSKTDQINRLKRLQLFEARLDSVLPSNVVVKRYKKSDTIMPILPGQFMKPRRKKRRSA